MVNNVEFGKRIKKIMEYHNLTASAFADKIEVQRSSISHILSGRNKPSLDFVLKITEHFDEVELNWLLYGTGNFPTNKNKIESINKEVVRVEKKTTPTLPDLFNQKIVSDDINAEKKITRIVLFYSDGSFEDYKN